MHYINLLKVLLCGGCHISANWVQSRTSSYDAAALEGSVVIAVINPSGLLFRFKLSKSIVWNIMIRFCCHYFKFSAPFQCFGVSPHYDIRFAFVLLQWDRKLPFNNVFQVRSGVTLSLVDSFIQARWILSMRICVVRRARVFQKWMTSRSGFYAESPAVGVGSLWCSRSSKLFITASASKTVSGHRSRNVFWHQLWIQKSRTTIDYW